jgi:BirA family biotin operon repressor/biotin-[acetyl-CoA-carboxylase] ligase
VLVFDRIDSTNSYAGTLTSDSANDGVVILAYEQTAGRGQPGRNWFCPRGSGVLMSVVLFPHPELQRAPALTVWAAVAVCDTIYEIASLVAWIKWPNDVLVNGTKVCGILTELKAGGANGPAAIVGIGLNVRQSAEEFANAGLPDAGSLSMIANRAFDTDDVAKRLIRQLDLGIANLHTLEARWASRVGLVGRNVTLELLDREVHGELRAMNFSAISLKQPDGRMIDLRPETVRHIR